VHLTFRTKEDTYVTVGPFGVFLYVLGTLFVWSCKLIFFTFAVMVMIVVTVAVILWELLSAAYKWAAKRGR
jgi:hypothetical protein